MSRTNDNGTPPDSSRDSNRPISIKAARKMLGMVGRNYSDEDITEILDILYGIAEEGYEAYLEENGGAKGLFE